MTRNRQNMLRLAGSYRRLEVGNFCVYCGDLANTRDHFIPVSVAAMLADIGTVVAAGKVTLPCCGNCNAIGGANTFKTVGAKRRYIQKRLRHKYRKLLDSPPWTDAEVAKLGRTLRTKILADQQKTRCVEQRIKWRNSVYSGIDAIGAPRALVQFFEKNGATIDEPALAAFPMAL